MENYLAKDIAIISAVERSQICWRPAGRFVVIDYLALQSSKMTWDSHPGTALSLTLPTRTQYHSCTTFIHCSSGQPPEAPRGLGRGRWSPQLLVSLMETGFSWAFLSTAVTAFLGQNTRAHGLAWESLLLWAKQQPAQRLWDLQRYRHPLWWWCDSLVRLSGELGVQEKIKGHGYLPEEKAPWSGKLPPTLPACLKPH